MEGGGRSKFISKAFLLPKEDILELARAKKIVGADKMTIFALLSALKMVPTHAQIKEHAASYGIKVSRGDGKEKILRLIRRYYFIRGSTRK